MRFFARVRMRYLVGALLVVVAAAAATLLLVAWSGIYSVAASRGHWAIVEWFLTFGMRNSVETHALAIDTPALDSPDLYRLGAGHFHSGCAYCHGAPGIPINPIARSMLPPPPDLSDATRQWIDRELFWIIKHGIKYTGMPAWASQQRDDEVWAVVAFLKQLPALDAHAYRNMALGGLPVAPQSGRELATAEATADAASACARCHGADERRPASGLVPILHGQPIEFLAAALRAFASGQRESGIMQPIANDLTHEAMRRVADYYSRLPAPPLPQTTPTADPAALERGRMLADGGDASAKIPQCSTCHDARALEIYPRLAGQHPAYMAGRLRRWKSGIVASTDTEAIMAPIARLLSDRQIDDVTSYFASLSGNSVPEAQRP
jgi:cytochrome c553